MTTAWEDKDGAERREGMNLRPQWSLKNHIFHHFAHENQTYQAHKKSRIAERLESSPPSCTSFSGRLRKRSRSRSAHKPSELPPTIPNSLSFRPPPHGRVPYEKKGSKTNLNRNPWQEHLENCIVHQKCFWFTSWSATLPDRSKFSKLFNTHLINQPISPLITSPPNTGGHSTFS